MHSENGILAVRRWGSATTRLARTQVAAGSIEVLTMSREVGALGLALAGHRIYKLQDANIANLLFSSRSIKDH